MHSIVGVSVSSNAMDAQARTEAGQTKFTVYHHKIFCFACGRAVIIQISY